MLGLVNCLPENEEQFFSCGVKIDRNQVQDYFKKFIREIVFFIEENDIEKIKKTLPPPKKVDNSFEEDWGMDDINKILEDSAKKPDKKEEKIDNTENIEKGIKRNLQDVKITLPKVKFKRKRRNVKGFL